MKTWFLKIFKEKTIWKFIIKAARKFIPSYTIGGQVLEAAGEVVDELSDQDVNVRLKKEELPSGLSSKPIGNNNNDATIIKKS